MARRRPCWPGQPRGRRHPLPALEKLLDFSVPAPRHHHESEDHVLWPLLIAADPVVETELGRLNAQHKALDAALEVLSATPSATTRTDPQQPERRHTSGTSFTNTSGTRNRSCSPCSPGTCPTPTGPSSPAP
ncbi:hemerythrin domain-containing protein [Streptomyces sp. NPDC086519]|uniref:hemerythrin domain-containing protein n=1 Tax=Streptomyces sp. NPDC086519 TaxID=3154863 RepID=UPI0034268913